MRSDVVERILLVVATAATLLAIRYDMLPLLRGPAPYPPEWQWEYRVGRTASDVLPAVGVAAGLLGCLAMSGLLAAKRRSRVASVVILGGATMLGVCLQIALLAVESGGAMDSLFTRAVSRTGTSYYTVAISPDARDPAGFLDRHAALLPEFRKAAKHAATHPPGPVLYYRGFIALCEASSRLTRSVLAFSGFPEVNPRRQRPQHTAESRAGALLGALGIALCCAATAWPVASLVRSLGGDALAAARTGVLWNLVPAAALMTPQFDQALALPVTGAVAALAVAARRPEGGMGWAMVAGVAGGIALFFSYGAPLFLLIGGLGILGFTGMRRLGHGVRVAIVAVVTCALMVALPIAFGHEPILAGRTALGIHREFYTQPRDYVLWLFFNPLDLAMFLGVPMALAALLRVARSAVALKTARPDDLERDVHGFHVGIVAGIAALVLSGLTRGEVGRIWLPLMPLMLIVATVHADRRATGSATAPVIATALLHGVLLAALSLTLRLCWQIP